MEVSATPAPVVATGYIPKNWSEEITLTQILVISLLPVVSLLLIYVLLRIVWKVPGSHGLPKYSQPSYGAIPSGESSLSHIDRPKSSLVEEGEVAGDYEESWLRTFDFVFLVGMMIYLAVLFILTFIYQPWLLTSSRFWLLQLPKLGVMMLVSLLGGIVCRFFCDLGVMMLVSLLGGIVCRFFCDVDEKGYIITNKSSKFKVNYTRKLQHFAAYMVPLVIKSEVSGPLALAWGDFFSMLGFLVLIKPIREHSKFFMLQFNSLDRPEDRPNTLKWIIAGNIAPGMFILLFFKWLFADQGALTFIIVFITGIGDGLAEPVGIAWGKHKYKTRGCFSKNKYTRSWEGKATAPHTMDTPVLMIGCGLILYIITHYF
ncbi:hypothetical protein ATCC90586_004329 [Pythium insidiosum]|nr:hypothetical protein ATCC90586_004329 [Pythium insidiosum]